MNDLLKSVTYVVLAVLLVLVVVGVCLSLIKPASNDGGRSSIAPAESDEARPISEPSAWIVSRVVDGDTIEVEKGGTTETVRLICVFAPKAGEPGFEEATDALRKLIGGKPLPVELMEVEGLENQYWCWLRDGETEINGEMVRLGHSTHSDIYRERHASRHD